MFCPVGFTGKLHSGDVMGGGDTGPEEELVLRLRSTLTKSRVHMSC
jgi:hypothetical protein